MKLAAMVGVAVASLGIVGLGHQICASIHPERSAGIYH
jgi:hypothetical protein